MPKIFNRNDEGFVLLWVIATVLVLSGLLFPAAAYVRMELSIAANQEELFRNDMLAQGLTNVIGHGILSGRLGSVSPIDQACVLDELVVRAIVQNHAGLVDLNKANETLLETSFSALDIEPGKASQLAREALTFRNPVYLGEEVAQGRFKHAPFEDVAEILELPSMPPRSIEDLDQTFTVYSQRGYPSAKLAAPHLRTVFERNSPSNDASNTVQAIDIWTVEIQLWSTDGRLIGFDNKVVSLTEGKIRVLQKRRRGADVVFPNLSLSNSCGGLFGFSSLREHGA